MRLFIAIDVSPEAELYTKDLQQHLKRRGLTFEHHPHLTLRFLGEQTPEQAETIKKQLQTLQFPSFQATLTNAGVFTPEDIKVVWIAMEPRQTLVKLHEKVNETLKLQKDQFEPHVTLARVKQHDKTLLETISKLPIKKIAFTVSKIILYQSTLSEKGSAYTPVATYSLT